MSIFDKLSDENNVLDNPACRILLKATDPNQAMHMNEVIHLFTEQLSRSTHADVITKALCRTFSGFVDRRQHQRYNSATTQRSHIRQELHVLLADDHPVNRQFLSTWLKQLGATVDEVSDGQQAVQNCTNMFYDLIFMDLHMPKMDGIEAANYIRDGSASLDTPIIAITADATEYAKRLIQHSTMNDYIVKPVAEEELLKIIEKWCPRFTQKQANQASQNSTPCEHGDNDDNIVDRSLGMQLASGNIDLWRWSLKTLAERLPAQQDELESAIKVEDYRHIAELAHSIVGAASYCGARELQQAATHLEQMAHTKSITNTNNAYGQLQMAISRFFTEASKSI
jgi:two-component system sensor histidine kinase BarA